MARIFPPVRTCGRSPRPTPRSSKPRLQGPEYGRVQSGKGGANPPEPEEGASIEQQFQAGPTWGKSGAPSNSASSSTVIGAKASGSQCTRPFNKPATRAG